MRNTMRKVTIVVTRESLGKVVEGIIILQPMRWRFRVMKERRRGDGLRQDQWP
jgi:hypothetical protein